MERDEFNANMKYMDELELELDIDRNDLLTHIVFNAVDWDTYIEHHIKQSCKKMKHVRVMN